MGTRLGPGHLRSREERLYLYFALICIYIGMCVWEEVFWSRVSCSIQWAGGGVTIHPVRTRFFRWDGSEHNPSQSMFIPPGSIHVYIWHGAFGSQFVFFDAIILSAGRPAWPSLSDTTTREYGSCQFVHLPKENRKVSQHR